MASKATIDSLLGAITLTLQYQLKDIIEKKEWGSINFRDAKESIDMIFDMVTDFKKLPLQYLPDSITIGITKKIVEINNTLQRIDSYILHQSVSQRDSLSLQIRELSEELYKLTATHIPFLAYKRGDYSEEIILTLDNLKKAYDENKIILKNENENVRKGLENLKQNTEKEIAEIIQNTRKMAAESGIVQFTEDFKEEYQERKKSAKYWLITSGIFAFITFVMIAVLYYIDFNIKTDFKYNQVAIQVSMIVLFFTITVWCSRMYRISMHQAILNKHRVLSLSTFQTFIRGTTDPHVKDAVLMEATRTIFNQGHTGYIDPKSDGSDSDTKVIEIIKNQIKPQ